MYLPKNAATVKDNKGKNIINKYMFLVYQQAREAGAPALRCAPSPAPGRMDAIRPRLGGLARGAMAWGGSPPAIAPTASCPLGEGGMRSVKAAPWPPLAARGGSSQRPAGAQAEGGPLLGGGRGHDGQLRWRKDPEGCKPNVRLELTTC